MLLEEIEDAIASLIKAPMEALGVRVRTTPDTDNSGVNTRGFLVVGYTGSSFSSVNQKFISNQQRTLTWELSLSYKDLQTHRDNYFLIEKLLELLTGFQPIDCDGFYGALYPKSDRFVTNSEGFWRYSISFSQMIDYPTLESNDG